VGNGFKQIGSIVVPETVQPDRVGLGCPRCDDHELVPFRLVTGGPQMSDAIQRFMRKHAACGQLEQLEQYGHVTGITGVVDPRPS
jgi:hypothetical protein